MRAKDAIRAGKTNIDLGKWNTGHIPRSAFPLSKAKDKNYKYGPSYRWRVVRFDALGHSFRVLILLNLGRHIFRASLAVEVAGDMRVFSQHEFHAGEPGWHCHLRRDVAATIDPGVFRGGMKRWPGGSTIPSKTEFGIADEADALKSALKIYRVEVSGTLI